MASLLATVDKQLKKKVSFEEGVKNLDRFFEESYACSEVGVQQEALRLVGRTHTLLKTRYSSLPFWKSGQGLFLNALGKVTSSAMDFKKVSEYLGSAESMVSEMEGDTTEMSPTQTREPTTNNGQLFEGQLSQGQDPSVEQDPLGYIPGERISEVLNLIMSHQQVDSGSYSVDQNGNAEHGATRNENEGEDGDEEDQEGGESIHDFAEELRRIQERIATALDATTVGMESVLAGLERVGQGVEDILEAAGLDEGANMAPPAAKIVVDSLPKKILSEEDIKTLGKDNACPVCMEQFKPGDEMTCLPCKHIFHMGCLKEWLDRTNSCPLCRHELPTDDRAYELRKEREEEQRGAQNALSHNEFMYI